MENIEYCIVHIKIQFHDLREIHFLNESPILNFTEYTI